MRGSAGIGRQAGLRCLCLTIDVRVQVPSPAPEQQPLNRSGSGAVLIVRSRCGKRTPRNRIKNKRVRAIRKHSVSPFSALCCVCFGSGLCGRADRTCTLAGTAVDAGVPVDGITAKTIVHRNGADRTGVRAGAAGNAAVADDIHGEALLHILKIYSSHFNTHFQIVNGLSTDFVKK